MKKRNYILLFIWHLSLQSFSAHDLHSSFWADYKQFANEPKIAFEWYKKFLNRPNLPGYMYKGLIHLLFLTNNTGQVIMLMHVVESSFESDIEMQLLFTQALQQAGYQTAADEKIIKILDTAKDNQQVAFYAAQVFLRRKELENALQTVEDYLRHASNRPNNFIFHFLEAQIFLSMDKKEEALEQIKKSLDIHPSFDKGWLLFALLNEQNGQLKKALKGYTTFLELTDVKNPLVQEHVLRLIFKQKLLETKENQLYLHMSYFEQALMLFKKNKYKKALKKINEGLDKHPNDIDSKVLKIQILNAMNQTEEAFNQLFSWIEQNNNTLWLQLTHLLATQQKMEHKTIEQLQKLQHKKPNHLELALYLSDLYARIGNVNKAIEQHKKAYNLTDDTTVKTKILAHLGIIYYDYNRLELMPDLIKQAEELDTDFAPLTNLIAYWYATKGHNLKRAEKLAQQLIKRDPDNPFFLDTQAIIYYKKHNYEQAQAMLEKSAELAPDEPLILKHLAKCYIKQDKKESALSVIKRALLYVHNEQEKKAFHHLIELWTNH